MTEQDLEPFLALVSEIEQARLGVGWKADDGGEPVPHEPTAVELLDKLLALYWQGRNAYDDLAAKIEGARTYAAIMDGAGDGH